MAKNQLFRFRIEETRHVSGGPFKCYFWVTASSEEAARERARGKFLKFRSLTLEEVFSKYFVTFEVVERGGKVYKRLRKSKKLPPKKKGKESKPTHSSQSSFGFAETWDNGMFI